MKRIFIVCLLLTAGGLFAQTSMFVSVGMEANGNGRNSAAMGGGFLVGVDINQMFSAGLKTTVSGDLVSVVALEPAGFFRYYLPLPISGFFAQAGLGVTIFFENDEGYPAFLGELAVGWRYNFIKRWYIEPSARFGYPFIWGVGLQAGLSFDIGGKK